MDRGGAPNERAGATVRCRGSTGWLSLSLEDNGDLVWEGANSTSSSGCAWPWSGKALPVKVFPLKELVGATLEHAGSGVRFWHCVPLKSGVKTHHVLKKSDRFEFSSREAAQQLVASVQRAASWGGKTSAPRVVAVVNPVSGRGKGRSIFSETVLPLLRDAAGMSVEVHTTTSKAHATKIIASADLSRVDLIMYVGGDGTVFEGLQGLMSRPDWRTAVKVPFCTIPTGSGNGLAASLGLWDATTAAYAACKRVTRPLDVASVLQPPCSRYYLLLSVAYGLMANLDIGTEHLRWMGEPRFTVGGIREILWSKYFPMRAALWPAHEPVPGSLGIPAAQPSRALSLSQAATSLGGGMSKAGSLGGASRARNASSAALATTAGNADTMTQSLLGAESSNSLDQQHIALAIPALMQQQAIPGTSLTAADSGEGAQLPGSSPSDHILGNYPGGPPLPILSQFGASLPSSLPAHDEALPAGWRTLPDQVASRAQYFMLQNTTHLALNAPFNPKADSSDGLWELMHVSGQAGWSGKLHGAQLLLASETGAHVDLDFVKTEKVRAMVIEPLAGDSTWMVLDGEQVPRDRAIFLEVHAQLCTALVAPSYGHLGIP